MLFALALLLAATSGPAVTDVPAQSRLGKILCVNPDNTTRTCSSIISYKPGPNGTLVETGEVLISPDQPITLEIASLGKVEGGAICGAVELADMQKGKLRVNGTPLPSDRNTAALNKLLERMKPMAGRKACEGLRVQNGQLVKYGQVERIDINLPGKPVRWISPSEGYRVAPRTPSN